MSCFRSRLPGGATASSPWRPPPPCDFASCAISGRPRSCSASSTRSGASPVTTRSPSLAAQIPAATAIEIGPSARSAGVPSSASTTRVSSTARSGTSSRNSSSRRWITWRSSNSAATSRRRLRSGFARASLRTSIGTSIVVLQGRELLRDPGVVGVLGEVLLALRARDLVDVVQHRLQRAELLQELGGGLVADPRNAGDVVGGVALEPDQVRHQLRGDAVTLDHPLAVVDLGVGDAARRGHHPNPVADHLVDVAIAGHDHHRDLRLARVADQGGDHVVGLPAFDLDVVEAERLRERRQVRPLLRQQVGPGTALGLVGLVGDLAPGHAGVPGDDHGLRPMLDQDLGHHRGEPVDRIGRAPVGGRDRLGEREERPVREAVAVDQEQLAMALGRALGFDLRLGALGADLVGGTP